VRGGGHGGVLRALRLQGPAGDRPRHVSLAEPAPGMTPARNVEIKARVADPAALRARVAARASAPPRLIGQTDTFFAVAPGRLRRALVALPPGRPGRARRRAAGARLHRSAGEVRDLELVEREDRGLHGIDLAVDVVAHGALDLVGHRRRRRVPELA